jgi:hypothetical protein
VDKFIESASQITAVKLRPISGSVLNGHKSNGVDKNGVTSNGTGTNGTDKNGNDINGTDKNGVVKNGDDKHFNLDETLIVFWSSGTTGVNFTNILRKAFSYKSAAQSFFVLTFKV